jgi:hypothetical protein
MLRCMASTEPAVEVALVLSLLKRAVRLTRVATSRVITGGVVDLRVQTHRESSTSKTLQWPGLCAGKHDTATIRCLIVALSITGIDR